MSKKAAVIATFLASVVLGGAGFAAAGSLADTQQPPTVKAPAPADVPDPPTGRDTNSTGTTTAATTTAPTTTTTAPPTTTAPTTTTTPTTTAVVTATSTVTNTTTAQSTVTNTTTAQSTVTNTSTAQSTVINTTTAQSTVANTTTAQATVTNTTTAQATTTAARTTTASFPPVDQCPNVKGLQTKVPTGMVKKSGKCVARLTLTASGLVKRPSHPNAGDQFAVGARILNAKNKKGLPSAVVTCPGALAGKPVTVSRTLFDKEQSAAYCYWVIPASAHGAVLQGAIVATYQGAHVRRWFKARVR